MSDKKGKRGSLSEAARTMGSVGGESTSASKKRAARENGKKFGGRPKGSTEKK